MCFHYDIKNILNPDNSRSALWGSFFLIYLLFFTVQTEAQQLILDTSFAYKRIWGFGSDTSVTSMKLKFGAQGCTVTVIKAGSHEYEAALTHNVTVKKDRTYKITFIAASDSSCNISIGFKQVEAPWLRYAIRRMPLKPELDTIRLTWVNSGPDAIAPDDIAMSLSIGDLKGTLYIKRLSVIEQVVSGTDNNDFECPVKPQLHPPLLPASELPSGLLAYSYSGAGTIYLSPLNQWAPVGIPGVEASPSNIAFSDDGKWLLYQVENAVFVIRIDGKFKTRVPVDDTLTACCFYRKSPFGLEIAYDLKQSEILRSIPVTFSDTGVIFGRSRTIADLSNKYAFENYYQFSIIKDQIWGAISPIVNGTIAKRSGFLTIPDAGRGIATFENLYNFSDDNREQVYGCSHTMTHDGQYCVANPGHAAETGDFSHCAPFQHKGFYVSRFYHEHDSAVTTREHVHRYSHSLNWCPDKYLPWEWTVVDFNLYQFTNNNSYLVAAQCGDSSSRKGLWAINWENNSWYPLNPDTIKINASGVAAYIGNYDSSILDSLSKIPTSFLDTSIKNPIGYKVLQPAGGEMFRPGDQCTIKVSSREEGNAAVKIQFGKYIFTILNRAINPLKDSVIVYTIPGYFTLIKDVNGTTVNEKIYPNSSQCRIRLEHYTPGICDPIRSAPFSITPKSPVIPGTQTGTDAISNATKAMQIQGIINLYKSEHITSLVIYDMLGRSVLDWNISTGTKMPFSKLLSCKLSNSVYIIRYSYKIKQLFR